jgi:2-amino-4-hydroxy-6-hydroxymethyldihydropteridine diphosphokinase
MSSDCETDINGPLQGLKAGIAFGSNIGDRLANLSKAKKLLLNECDAPSRAIFSPVYETAPVDCAPGTRSFYNAVGQLPFRLAPELILRHCLKIEQSLGRADNHEKNSPRTIDLDLLYADDIVSVNPRLTIPHPRLTMRLFVVAPLAKIRPGLYLPGDRLSINDHLKALLLKQAELRKITHDW